MATTPNFNLPLITDSMTADVPRDLDALAQAADSGIGAALDDVEVPEATMTTKGITSLSSAIDSDSETEAATPKAIHGAAAYIDAQAAYGKASLIQQAKRDIPGLQREIANFNMQLEASKRVTNGATFGSNFADSFGMTIDTTKTKTTASLAAGAKSITVESSAGLVAGMEVTVYDDTNIERVSISAVNGNVLTVPALAKAYKTGATVARTSAIVDAANKALKFGGWETTTTNTVNFNDFYVGTGLSLAGNGNRKVVRLENGWIVAALKTVTAWYTVMSKDNGLTWGLQQSISASSVQDLALVTIGNFYGLLYCTGGALVVFRCYDAIKNTQSQNNVNLDTTASNIQNCSMAVNEAGTELHVCWNCKNSSYPNSHNIRYAKGTIDKTIGAVTFGAVEQLTTYNNSVQPGFFQPSIIVDQNNNPAIATCFNTSSSQWYVMYLSQSLTVSRISNCAWKNEMAYIPPSGYSVTNTTLLFVPQRVNQLSQGRVFLAWDSVETDSAKKVRNCYSDNSGKSWSLRQTVTGPYLSEMPTMAADKNGDVYLLARGFDSLSDQTGNIARIYKSKFTSALGGYFPDFVSMIQRGSITEPNALLDLSIDIENDLPLFISNTTVTIKFAGSWLIPATVPILENDIRFTVKNTDEAVMWVQRDAGLTVTAALNGQTMDKTTAGNEDQFIKALSAAGPAEIRLNMKRTATSDDVKITRILGGVG